MDPQGSAVRERVAARVAAPASRVGREGRLALAFARASGRTVLTERRFELPLQFLEPIDLAGDGTAIAPLLNPTGGVLGGDRLRTSIRVGEGASVCATTPSATRVYRCDLSPARIETRLEVARGAVLEYVPEHLIPHPGSALVQRLEVDVAAGGRAVVWDAWSLGRVVRGESWSFARLELETRVRVAGRLAFLERVRLTPEARALDPAAGQAYTGTLVAVGPPDEPWQRWAAELEALAAPADARVGASALAASGLALRVLAASACSLAEVFESRWSALRQGLLGRPPLALRKP
jgi:urease accessory protein